MRYDVKCEPGKTFVDACGGSCQCNQVQVGDKKTLIAMCPKECKS